MNTSGMSTSASYCAWSLEGLDKEVNRVDRCLTSGFYSLAQERVDDRQIIHSTVKYNSFSGNNSIRLGVRLLRFHHLCAETYKRVGSALSRKNNIV